MAIGQVTIDGVVFNINVTYYDEAERVLNGSPCLQERDLDIIRANLESCVTATKAEGLSLRSLKKIKLNNDGVAYDNDLKPYPDISVSAKKVTKIWEETQDLLLKRYQPPSEGIVPLAGHPLPHDDNVNPDLMTHSAASSRRGSATSFMSATSTDESDPHELASTIDEDSMVAAAAAAAADAAADLARLPHTVASAVTADVPTQMPEKKRYYDAIAEACYDEAKRWDEIVELMKNSKEYKKELESEELKKALKRLIHKKRSSTTSKTVKTSRWALFRPTETTITIPTTYPTWEGWWKKYFPSEHFRDISDSIYPCE